MGKAYGHKVFSCTLPNGERVSYYCHAEDTRYGFRHLCISNKDLGYKKYTTKRCYYNRTWERFTYESVLADAIDMIADNVKREYVRGVLIEQKAENDRIECEKFLSAFKAEYDKLPDSTKEVLKGVTVTNEKQASSVLATMKAVNLLNGK